MMASAQVVETSVNTNNSPSQDYTTSPDDQIVETSVNANINNSPSQDYTTNPDDHSNHNVHVPAIFTCRTSERVSSMTCAVIPSYSPWKWLEGF